MPSLARIALLALLAAAAAIPRRKAPAEAPDAAPAVERTDRIDVVEAAVRSARAQGALGSMTDEEARAAAREVIALQEIQVHRNPIVSALMDEQSLKQALSPVRPARRLRDLLHQVLPRIEWFLWSVPGSLLLAGAVFLLAGRHEAVASIAAMGELYCWGWLTFLCAVVAATGWMLGTNPWDEIPRFIWGAPFVLWLTTGLLSLSVRGSRKPSRRRRGDHFSSEAMAADLSPTVSRRLGQAVDRLLERWLN